MAGHACLKNEFTEDEKCHNLELAHLKDLEPHIAKVHSLRWLIWQFVGVAMSGLNYH